jgi:hypothetical protein
VLNRIKLILKSLCDCMYNIFKIYQNQNRPPQQRNNAKMTSTITSKTMMSVFIPHVFENVRFEKIAHTFESLELGVVSRVEWIPKTHSLMGKPYKSCFVFFSEWYDTTASVNLRNKIKEFKRNVKLVYDDPHYWNLCENNSEVSSYPENKHYDLELCVPNTTTFEEVKKFLVELDLGQIGGLTVTTSKDDYMINHGKNTCCPSNWKNIVDEHDWKGYMFPGHMLIKVNFDYWYRTLTAVKFQEEMSKSLDEGLYFPVSFNTIWKVTVSSTPSNSDGYNPYVWYNTDIDVKSFCCEMCESESYTSESESYTSESESNTSESESNTSESAEAINDMLNTLRTLSNKLKTFKYTSLSSFRTDRLLYNYNKTMLESLDEEHPNSNIKMRIRNIALEE